MADCTRLPAEGGVCKACALQAPLLLNGFLVGLAVGFPIPCVTGTSLGLGSAGAAED
jgi:hypothetical protein